MAAYVAKRGEPLRMNLSTAIQRFPNGLDEEDSDEDLLEKSAYILCLPGYRKYFLVLKTEIYLLCKSKDYVCFQCFEQMAMPQV